MRDEKAFQLMKSLWCEAAFFLAWVLVTDIPIKVIYDALNNNIFLYLSGVVLVFALLRGYRSYSNLKTAPNFWYKEPFVFLALGDICWSYLLLLIHLSQFSNTPDNGEFVLYIFFLFSWVILMLVAAFVLRKYYTR